MSDLMEFRDWAQLIAHIRAEYALWYQAPMDIRPALVTAIIRKDGKLRVTSWHPDFVNFTADPGHLSRFRRHASRVTLAELGVKP